MENQFENQNKYMPILVIILGLIIGYSVMTHGWIMCIGIATLLGISAFYWILGAVAVVGGVVAWNVTQRPDITYNISDTGFSLAGVDVSWFLIIGLVAIAIVFIIFMGRKKPTEKEYVYVGKPK